MKQWYKHNDRMYIIHRAKPINSFTDKQGHLRMDIVKEYRDYLNNVDHVLKTDSHFLFVETIQDAEIIEEIQNVVEETHS
jgi:methionine synthase I (cobalamin-dependent)